MKPTKFKLSRIPIDREYAPGYPRQLTREEFEALLEPRNRERVRALWGAACATLAFSAGGGSGADREARVVELLQREADAHANGHGWLWSASMLPASGTAETSGHVYIPAIPISFGNSSMGLFDAGAARKLAGEIFRAYGLELETGIALETPGVQARLDGADRARKLGFKLRGLVTRREMQDQGEDEPAATDLQAAERAALEKEGWQLHVADVRSYPLMDGDQLTPTLAYICGVVEFLNSVTDGPDLDLRSVLMGERLRFAVPDLKALGLSGGAPRAIGTEETWQEFVLKEPCTLTLRFNAPGSSAPLQRPRGRWPLGKDSKEHEPSQPLSTVGHISALELPVQTTWPLPPPAPGKPGPGPLHATLQQPRDSGAAPLRIECRNELVFTPSSFDAARPFEIVIELQPAKYLLKNWLDVSVLGE